MIITTPDDPDVENNIVANEKHSNMHNTNEDDDNSNVSPNRPHPALEYLPLYFLLKYVPCLSNNIKHLYSFRWKISNPLGRKIIGSKLLRKAKIHLTWGEALLLLPFWLGILWTLLRCTTSVSETGHVARTALIGCFVLAQRNSMVTFLLGMPVDRTLFYHKLSGRVALLGTVTHVSAFFLDPKFQKGSKFRIETMVQGQVNLSGTIMMYLVVVIILSSLPFVRRKAFEVFYYAHIVAVAGLTVGAFFHTGVLVPILVALTWGVDVFLRSIVMARSRYPRKATIHRLSDTVIELSFPKVKGFDYNPGQYMYLSIPEISWLQWHPFSLSSSPKMKRVTFHIRKAGNWTSALYELAGKQKEVSIMMEGPYGSLGVDLVGDRYKMVMLVGGGIGSKY